MGKNLLTDEQKSILELASIDDFVTNTFYFTGGTALSYFYLKHRFSEDLDFFSKEDFNPKLLVSSVSKIGDKLKPTKIEQQTLSGQEVFYFYFDGDKKVKVDFAIFPFDVLGSFRKSGKLRVSSIEDIAVNKVHAITTRKRARDYLDLYLCTEKLGWDAKDLRKYYKLKFDIDLPVEQIATSFINILDAQDQPIFLGGQNFDEVKKFFLKQADKLKGEMIK